MTDAGTDESHYRGYVTQKAVIFNERGQVLLVRSSSSYPWSIPGGRLESGEDAEAALAREIREETDLEVEVQRPVHVMTDVWHSGTGESMYAVVYRCETSDTGVTLNHEHEEYTWVRPPDAKTKMPLQALTTAIERALADYRSVS